MNVNHDDTKSGGGPQAAVIVGGLGAVRGSIPTGDLTTKMNDGEIRDEAISVCYGDAVHDFDKYLTQFWEKSIGSWIIVQPRTENTFCILKF